MTSQAQNQPQYYRDGQHLRAKHQLAGDDFARWVIDHIPNWERRNILDAGGGWGRFVWLLADQYDADLSMITLTDISDGMLKTAEQEAASRGHKIATTACDIVALPFKDHSFDVVMANKVLYHLSDIPMGVSELARVLQPQGTVLATTNSDKITAMIIDLHYQALDKVGIPYTPEPPSPFSMENGGDYLRLSFKQVETHYYEDEDLISDAAQIRATYETIGRYRNLLSDDNLSQHLVQSLPDTVQHLADAIIQRDGFIRSPTLMGVFVCSEPI